MKAAAKGRFIERVRKPILALALSCSVLVAGPFGCSGNLRLKSSNPTVQKVEQIRKVRVKRQGKDFARMKSGIQKEIQGFESEIVHLQARKALVELGGALAKLVGLREEINIGPLEQLGIQGNEKSSQLNAALAGRSRTDGEEKLKTLAREAQEICARIRVEFEKVRVLEEIKTNDEVTGLEKRIRRMKKGGIMRIIYRTKRTALAKRIRGLKEKLGKLGGMKGHFDQTQDSQLVEQRIGQSMKKVRELSRALQEVEMLEKTGSIRRMLKWLQSLRELQERRGIDSSLTKSDISDYQARLREIEKAAERLKW